MNERRLSVLVAEYDAMFNGELNDWVGYYAELPTLAIAIGRAALARGPEGQKHSHQRRLPNVVLREFADSLLGAQERVASSATFAELIAVVDECRVAGVGELALYDTAVRIGAWLRLSPEHVYLHAGTRKGAAALGLDVEREAIPLDEFPPALHRLTADDLENFLCIFKADLAGVALDSRAHGRATSCAPRNRQRLSKRQC